MTRRNFQVLGSAWAAYWSTQLSVSSLLEMAYPVINNELNVGTEEQLYWIIGGDNILLRFLTPTVTRP